MIISNFAVVEVRHMCTLETPVRTEKIGVMSKKMRFSWIMYIEFSVNA